MVVLALLLALTADARVLMSQRDALALAFPSAPAERRTAFLTDAQLKAAQEKARAKIDSAIWTYYAGKDGYAYFESHPVRTMDETFMVALDAAGRVRFVEILAFAEPEDYLAGKRWLKQLEGRALDDELLLRRGLRGMTGATLTSEAVVKGVRRVLAVHEVIHSPRP